MKTDGRRSLNFIIATFTLGVLQFQFHFQFLGCPLFPQQDNQESKSERDRMRERERERKNHNNKLKQRLKLSCFKWPPEMPPTFNRSVYFWALGKTAGGGAESAEKGKKGEKVVTQAVTNFNINSLTLCVCNLSRSLLATK